VLRDRGIGDAARVLALLLAEHADGNGYVGLPREQLTEMLGVDPSRITQRRAELVATGYLHLVRRHAPGRPATYVLILPTRPSTVEHDRVSAPISARRVDGNTTGLARRVESGDIQTTGTDTTGLARRVPIETPVQDDPWATDAHHLRTAAPQTKDAATEDQQRSYAAREQDGRSPLALALARSPIQRGRA
jgi:hypothetical protein